MQTVWPKLCTDDDEEKAFRNLKTELREQEGLFAEGCAALPLLEAQLCNAACIDPGAIIVDQAILPLLQQRLSARAQSFHDDQASVCVCLHSSCIIH